MFFYFGLYKFIGLNVLGIILRESWVQLLFGRCVSWMLWVIEFWFVWKWSPNPVLDSIEALKLSPFEFIVKFLSLILSYGFFILFEFASFIFAIRSSKVTVFTPIGDFIDEKVFLKSFYYILEDPKILLD